ncbi:hypothetical protein [Actinomadura sp. NPDC048394]|jgi:hypothetical protein|uniref:hypothetical protein n=1 Tax=Actinomadura sp. NPDC048394 TaxID=3158223 RepID=UPI0034077695
MPDPQDASSEVRFRPSGWTLYGGGLAWAGVPAAAAALFWGVVAMAHWGGPDFRMGVLLEVRSLIFGGLLTLFSLTWCGLLAYGAIKTRRIWGRYRRPPAVLRADGVRFQARRGDVTVPWADIEQMVLRHALKGRKPVSAVRIRLAPDAALLRGGEVRPPTGRWLVVGVLPYDVDIPMAEAVERIKQAAGPRLEILDTSHAAESPGANTDAP